MNSNLKVGILTTSFPRFEGDFAGTFVDQYARELARSGCQVKVLAPHDTAVNPSRSRHGCEVNYFKYFFPQSLQSLAYGAGMVSRLKQNWLRALQMPFFLVSFFLSALRLAGKSDLLHAYWTPSGLVALMVKGIRNVPVVVTLWGSDIYFARTPLFAGIFKWLMRKADAIVCESDSFRNQLIQLGIPTKKISVIANGIDFEAFKPSDKTTARRRLNLPQDKTIIINVGGLSPVKDQKILIEAASQIIANKPDLLLVLVGEGETRKELEALVQSKGLQEQVHFTGFQKVTKIPDWLNSADIFVLTSVSEGNPNIILEAMSSGLPIIATAVGGIPEMIRDGEEGLLIPPRSPEALAEKLNTLLGDPELQKKLSQNALKTVQSNYASWEKQASQLKALYAGLLNR